MSRHLISLSHEQLTSCELEAFVAHADARNQHHLEVCTTPFPMAPSRWLSPYRFFGNLRYSRLCLYIIDL